MSTCLISSSVHVGPAAHVQPLVGLLAHLVIKADDTAKLVTQDE